MTQHEIRLREVVQEFVRGKSNVTLDEIIEHLNSRGHRVHGEMFADWLSRQGIEVDRHGESTRGDVNPDQN